MSEFVGPGDGQEAGLPAAAVRLLYKFVWVPQVELETISCCSPGPADDPALCGVQVLYLTCGILGYSSIRGTLWPLFRQNTADVAASSSPTHVSEPECIWAP